MALPKIIQEVLNRVSFAGAQTLTDAQKTQARANIGAPDDAAVVKLTGAQSVSGVKTFSDSPLVPTLADRFDKSLKTVNSTWAYGLARQGNYLDLINLGTPDDDFWKSIDNGTFSKAPVGGYFVINGHTYYLAHQDYWLNIGLFSKHHVAMVYFSNRLGQINSTSTTNGGYAGSDFWTGNNGNTARADFRSQIQTDFGASHILTIKEHLSNAVTNGVVTGNAYYDTDVDLLSEEMLYGCKIMSPIGETPASKSQLKLFAQHAIPGVYQMWLRNVCDSSRFAVKNGNGTAGSYYAGDTTNIQYVVVFAIGK